MTTREQLLAKAAPEYRDVTLPDGDVVCIRRLPDGDKITIELEMVNRKTHEADFEKLPAVRWKTVAWSLVDGETKERMFGDDEWDQVKSLPSAIVECIFKACQELNGNQKELVQELVGNSN